MNVRTNSDGILKQLEEQRHDQDVGEHKAVDFLGGKCSWLGRLLYNSNATADPSRWGEGSRLV